MSWLCPPLPCSLSFIQSHSWVIADLPNPEQWIRDTEPSGYHDDDFEGEEFVSPHVPVSQTCDYI